MPTPGNPYRQFTGVVVSAGKMMKTVRVRIPGQKWDKLIRKDFPAPYHVLVSDPTESVREGDVVTLRNGWRTSKHVHHVVTSIVAPFGPEISKRPPIPTEEERQQQLLHTRLEKDLRKAALGRQASIQHIRQIAQDDGWVQELPQRLADAWKQAKEAGIVRTSEKQEQMPPINVLAQQNVAAAAEYTEKGLENEEQAEQAQKAGESMAEDVIRGGKTI
ncbi:ribosomal protein s17 [Diplodia corticola]|uniref:Ribosomal protein s17 n=1 Tax=Diplodia corticola TaxID=236234 RepID=A0A1J9SB28_9PEZI|nr:ribosomal protein s17 [Diplodia corticola]OJD37068.1 ribosomal protein s17 [Diplodia corticola]